MFYFNYGLVRENSCNFLKLLIFKVFSIQWSRRYPIRRAQAVKGWLAITVHINVTPALPMMLLAYL